MVGDFLKIRPGYEWTIRGLSISKGCTSSKLHIYIALRHVGETVNEYRNS